MRINLFTTTYKDKNPDRQNELDFCLKKNDECFNSIHLVEDLSIYWIDADGKTKMKTERPTYNHFLGLLDDHPNDINVISNADIFFTRQELEKIIHYFGELDPFTAHITCMALSRWDYFHDGSSIHFDRADSQDCWIFSGSPNYFRLPEDFSMGIAGCDNRFAYEMLQKGINVVNPSKSIKSFHYHCSNIRNYIDATGNVQRIPPPYHLVTPTF